MTLCNKCLEDLSPGPPKWQDGTFIPSHELEASRLLLAGSAWESPAPQPFWLPEETSTNTYAASAADSAATVGMEASRGNIVPDETKTGCLDESPADPAATNGPDEVGTDSNYDEPHAVTEAPSSVAHHELPAPESATDATTAEPSDAAAVVPSPAALVDTAPKAFSSGWRPLPPPPEMPIIAASASDGSDLSPEQQAGRAARSVLRGALAEALDPSRLSPLVNAWGCLRPGRVPAFAELRDRIPDEYRCPASLLEPETKDDKVLQSRRFQEFAEYVLENAVLGLVNESVAGEWSNPSL